MNLPALQEIDPKDDPRPIEALIHVALTAPEELAAWNAIWALHHRGSRDVLVAAVPLCFSECPLERVVGADIVSRLGHPGRAFPEESVEILLEMLELETEPGPLSAILSGLSINLGERAIPIALRFADHADLDVRHKVVLALSGHEDSQAVNALIRLTQDSEGFIRDWATFALGTQLELDTPEIREALVARLEDTDCNARSEAFAGLARRGDRCMVPALQKELSSGSVGTLDVEAAALIGAPDLYPVLLSLRSWWDVVPELLDEAIAACQPA